MNRLDQSAIFEPHNFNWTACLTMCHNLLQPDVLQFGMLVSLSQCRIVSDGCFIQQG